MILLVTITTSAALVILQALSESDVEPGQGLRLYSDQLALTLDVDYPSDSDKVLNYLGSNLIIIDKALDDSLGHAIIDIGDGPDGLDLVIRRSA